LVGLWAPWKSPNGFTRSSVPGRAGELALEGCENFDYLHMGAEDIGADRLGYGYAITGHRAQGATVEVAHVLDDGGGRELAYVAMSRARNASHVLHHCTRPHPSRPASHPVLG
jgi:hypothetical protein